MLQGVFCTRICPKVGPVGRVAVARLHRVDNMQHIVEHWFVHPHFTQLWSSQSSNVLSSTTQHHAASGAPQQSPELALPSPMGFSKPAYLPSNKVISSAREVLARCNPEQVLQCLRPFADRLRMQGWTLLIADCGKCGEHHKALAVFQAVPQKNVWHHSALIAALGACGQCEQALHHLEQLKQLALQDSALQPNHVTYSAAIAACARVQRLDRVMQLFTEMQEQGLEPDSVAYYIVQSTAVRVGKWQLVDNMLQTMHSKGIPARPMVYSAYIRQLCRTQQWNQALGIFLIMQDLGVPATSAMIAELLRTFNHCGKPQMAVLLLKEAEAAGLINSAGMYDSTLKALLAAGHVQTAAELCDFMQQTGRWQPASSFLDQLQNGSAAVDQAVVTGEAKSIQGDIVDRHPAAAVAVACQAAAARADRNHSRSTAGSSDSQISPASSCVGHMTEAAADCLEHCEAACYLPAAACSCAFETETEDCVVSNASSSVAGSVVSSPLACSGDCTKSCSTSTSTGSISTSFSTASRQQKIAALGSSCSDTALAVRASAGTAGQQPPHRNISVRSSNTGGSRQSYVHQSFQHYNGRRIDYGMGYHSHQYNHQSQLQHRVKSHVPHYHYNHHQYMQRHQWSGYGQRASYHNVTYGLSGAHEHVSQHKSNYQQQQHTAQQQQQQSLRAACGDCTMASHAEAAVATALAAAQY